MHLPFRKGKALLLTARKPHSGLPSPPRHLATVTARWKQDRTVKKKTGGGIAVGLVNCILLSFRATGGAVKKITMQTLPARHQSQPERPRQKGLSSNITNQRPTMKKKKKNLFRQKLQLSKENC